MHEANATGNDRTRLIGEVTTGVSVWLVFTALVVAIAPVIAPLPITALALIVTPLCGLLGWLIGGAARRWRPHPQAGTRVGVAVVVVGQLLDVVMIAAAAEYPGAGRGEGTATIVTLLLGGYAAFLLGATLTDRARERRSVMGASTAG